MEEANFDPEIHELLEVTGQEAITYWQNCVGMRPHQATNWTGLQEYSMGMLHLVLQDMEPRVFCVGASKIESRYY